MNIPMDKQAHFWWGAAMTGVIAHTDIHLLGAMAISAFFGLVKEFMDYEADGEDFVATLSGAISAAAIVFLIRL